MGFETVFGDRGVVTVFEQRSNSAHNAFVSGSLAISGVLTIGGINVSQSLAGKATTDIAILAYSGSSNTLALVDGSKYLRVFHPTNTDMIIPNNTIVPFGVGTVIQLRQCSTGQIQFVTGSGIILNSSETIRTRKSGSLIGLIKVATNEWDLSGDLELM